MPQTVQANLHSEYGDTDALEENPSQTVQVGLPMGWDGVDVPEQNPYAITRGGSGFVAAIVNFAFYERVVPNRYLELGVGDGSTFNRVVITCDLACAVDRNDMPHLSTLPQVRQFKCTTEEFIKNILPELGVEFGAVFIDANHSHKQSLADFLGVVPYVVENGIVILHDTYPADRAYLAPNQCSDCYKTAWYIRTELKDAFEIVTLPSNCGISIVRKASRQLLWMEA